MAKKSIVKTILVIVACLGDQISDVIYVITNWDSFGNLALRNASLAFLIMPFIICMGLGVYLMTQSNGLKECGMEKVCIVVVFCGWIPLVMICTFLIWTKILQFIEYCDLTSKITEEHEAVKKINWFSHHLQVFFEDIPQVIIQAINNQLNHTWDLIAIISMCFSVILLIKEVVQFLFCRNEDEVNHQNSNDGDIQPRKDTKNVTQVQLAIDKNNYGNDLRFYSSRLPPLTVSAPRPPPQKFYPSPPSFYPPPSFDPPPSSFYPPPSPYYLPPPLPYGPPPSLFYPPPRANYY